MVKNVNNSYARIAQWLKEYGNKEFFGILDISKALELDSKTVHTFLSRRHKKGLFEKKVNAENNEVQYRMVPKEISVEIPKGKLSDTVFKKLKEYNSQFPELYLAPKWIFERVKKEIPTVTADSVDAVLKRWNKSGFLERNTSSKNYGYRLKDPQVTQRPTTTTS